MRFKKRRPDLQLGCAIAARLTYFPLFPSFPFLPLRPVVSGLLLLAAICLTAIFTSFTARAADEESLQDLWKLHTSTPDDHEAVLKACKDYETAHAGDSLLPVVRGLEEWRLIRAGRRTDALQMMAADLAASAGPVADGARRLAQGWVTRVDREQVAAALQTYYKKQVAYPKTLDQLPPDPRTPLKDRYGKPWSYKLTGFAKLPGFTDQKYSLQSPALGDISEFKAAAQLPYAARILSTPAQILSAPGNTQAVKFNLTGGAAVVGVGQATGDLYVAFVGTQIVVVCDYTHWKIFPRP